VQNKKEQLFIKIKDEGVGIPDEDQHHLFTTFFRGKNVTNVQGTGLGLPIVKRYLDLLKGDIILESKLNVGTTVSVRLPLLKENEEQFA
jgi:signal transduction histidine kinase